MIFEPSDTFDGPHQGYVFKRGADGLGYYWDPHFNQCQ